MVVGSNPAKRTKTRIRKGKTDVVELDPKVLHEAAKKASEFSYSPYSKFKVGAAVLCESGQIVTGCNVENASYGLTMCAERTTIFTAIARGETPVAIAITCPDGDPGDRMSQMPCGACRQVMAEFMKPGSLVVIEGSIEYTVGELIPCAFSLIKPAKRKAYREKQIRFSIENSSSVVTTSSKQKTRS